MGWIYFVYITPGISSEQVKLKPMVNEEVQLKTKKEISSAFLMENFWINWTLYGFSNSFFKILQRINATYSKHKITEKKCYYCYQWFLQFCLENQTQIRGAAWQTLRKQERKNKQKNTPQKMAKAEYPKNPKKHNQWKKITLQVLFTLLKWTWAFNYSVKGRS